MQLRLEFEEKVADIKPSIVTMETAMDEVLSCGALIELFHVALITGNIINGVCVMGYVLWGMCYGVCVMVHVCTLSLTIPSLAGWACWRCLWLHHQISVQTERHKSQQAQDVPAPLHSAGRWGDKIGSRICVRGRENSKSRNCLDVLNASLGANSGTSGNSWRVNLWLSSL